MWELLVYILKVIYGMKFIKEDVERVVKGIGNFDCFVDK